MAERSRARYLAPIALMATIAGVYLIAHSALNTTHAPTTATSTSTTLTSARRTRAQSQAKFYVVKQGDTLSMIALKTGLSISALQALNPRIDPNALQTGQRLRLRR